MNETKQQQQQKKQKSQPQSSQSIVWFVKRLLSFNHNSDDINEIVGLCLPRNSYYTATFFCTFPYFLQMIIIGCSKTKLAATSIRQWKKKWKVHYKMKLICILSGRLFFCLFLFPSNFFWPSLSWLTVLLLLLNLACLYSSLFPYSLSFRPAKLGSHLSGL